MRPVFTWSTCTSRMYGTSAERTKTNRQTPTSCSVAMSTNSSTSPPALPEVADSPLGFVGRLLDLEELGDLPVFNAKEFIKY